MFIFDSSARGTMKYLVFKTAFSTFIREEEDVAIFLTDFWMIIETFAGPSAF